jgi:hypothetical protein
MDAVWYVRSVGGQQSTCSEHVPAGYAAASVSEMVRMMGMEQWDVMKWDVSCAWFDVGGQSALGEMLGEQMHP